MRISLGMFVLGSGGQPTGNNKNERALSNVMLILINEPLVDFDRGCPNTPLIECEKGTSKVVGHESQSK